MGAHDRMVHRLGWVLVLDRVAVDGAEAVHPRLEAVVECLVRRVAVAPLGAAAAVGDLDRVEQGQRAGAAQVGEVGVEAELAVAQGADRLPVLLDVGDQEDLLDRSVGLAAGTCSTGVPK